MPADALVDQLDFLIPYPGNVVFLLYESFERLLLLSSIATLEKVYLFFVVELRFFVAHVMSSLSNHGDICDRILMVETSHCSLVQRLVGC